jgi:hypothetical protein
MKTLFIIFVWIASVTLLATSCISAVNKEWDAAIYYFIWFYFIEAKYFGFKGNLL